MNGIANQYYASRCNERIPCNFLSKPNKVFMDYCLYGNLPLFHIIRETSLKMNFQKKIRSTSEEYFNSIILIYLHFLEDYLNFKEGVT